MNSLFKTQRSRRGLMIAIFLMPTLIMYFLIFLWPLCLSIYSSFCKWDGFSPMEYIGLENYRRLISDGKFVAAIQNSLKWALCAVFIHVPFGVLVALVISRKLAGWRFIRSCFMVPNIISQSGMALMFMFIFKPDAGILNSIIRVFAGPEFDRNWLYDPNYAFASLTQFWLWYAAVIMLITLSELSSISTELYEAAKIDGASEFQIDWKINIPLLRNSIGTGIIVAVTSVFKMFDIIFMTTNGGPGTSTINLAVMSVNAIITQNRYGYANAIGIFLLLMGGVVMGITTLGLRMNKVE